MFYQNFYRIITILISVQTINATNKCNWFKNVKITVHPLDGSSYPTTINGCIEETLFNDKIIIEAYIQEQKIPNLGPDSIRNMTQLTIIAFYKCEINSLESGAFRNVPRLRTVKIVKTNLQEMPRDVFQEIPELELIRLHENRIETIEDQAFANLSKLRRILINNNLLEYWNRDWFTNSTNLQILDFRFNKIRRLPRFAFKGLNKLKQICLDFNEISSIELEAFERLTGLDYLGLKYNRLTIIDYGSFPKGNNLKIGKLAIDANYLNFLPNELLKKWSVKEVSLNGNPWKCPCLDNINFWLHTINGTTISDDNSCRFENTVPVCAYPLSFSRTCLETVDKELTNNFLKGLRSLNPPLKDYCARLD